MNIEEIDKKIQEINNLLKRKQFPVSERKSLELIKLLEPVTTENYQYYIEGNLLLAESLTKNVKNLKALEVLEKVHENYPYETKVLSKIYDLSIKLKRGQKAENALKLFVAIEPDNVEERIKLINFYIEKKDYQFAITELYKLISVREYDSQIIKLLAFVLGEEGLYSKKLEQIKLLQGLEPDNNSLIIEESRCLIDSRDFVSAFNLINNLIEYNLQNSENTNVFNEVKYILLEFSNLYLGLGNKHLLAEIFIKLLIKENGTYSNENLQVYKEISKKGKFDLILNFFTKPNISNIKIDLTNNEAIENLIYLADNSKYFNNNQKLSSYMQKINIENFINSDYLPFIYSMLTFYN